MRDERYWEKNPETGAWRRRRPPAEAAEEVDATDAAEKLAAELGVDIAKVQGTGQDGRITKGDVEAAAEAV